MDNSIGKIERPVRRRLKRVMQKSKDIKHARRAQALLLLHEYREVSVVARLMGAARSAINEWKHRFKQFGEAGLVPQPPGRKTRTTTDEVGAHLLRLVEHDPRDYGYLKGRWSSEMLAEQIRREQGQPIHASTVRRWLPRLGIYWNRARPTLCLADRQKSRKMKAINRALAQSNRSEPVFYVDEVDIDLNPRIGHCWMKQARQTTIPTPGKNEKRYLAGALNAMTGNLVWVEWHKKNSELFIQLLAELQKRYRRARTITLIADNYVIHKSAMTHCFLSRNRKFKILFQPAYHPWVNRIERLWKQLHDVVTRNHKYTTMKQLMGAVHQFMEKASPFPGSFDAAAKL